MEFPCVFVAGFTEGIFPSARTLEERKLAGLEEERRLCFVAMTRARERLYLTESEGAGSGGARKLPSRFLFDVADETHGVYQVQFDKSGKTKPISMDFCFGAASAPDMTKNHATPDVRTDTGPWTAHQSHNHCPPAYNR